MSAVSCRVVVPLVDEVAKHRDPDFLVRGLAFDIALLRDPAARIGWDDYTVVLDRTQDAIGGPDALEELGAAHAQAPATGITAALASSFLSLRVAYEVGAKWYGPSFFSCTSAENEFLAHGGIRQTVEIEPGYRDSDAFFRLMRGVLRATPVLLGRKQAVVHMERRERRAIYTITPPPRLSLWRTLRRWLDRDASIAPAIKELLFRERQLEEALSVARASAEALSEQTDRLDTLNRLGRSLVTQDAIGGLADTLFSLRDTYLPCRGLVLWMVPADDGPLTMVRRSGEIEGPPTLRRILRTSNAIAGRVDVWCDGGADPEWLPLLEDLLPWVSLGLENARAFRVLRDDSRRRESEGAERARVERNLALVQRMEAVGEVAGSVAHSFKDAVLAIRDEAELALQHLEDGSPGAPHVREILSRTETATELAKNLVALSRREPGRVRPTDLSATLRNLEPSIAKLVGPSIRVHTSWPGEPVWVLAEEDQLEQIVIHLVARARDSMREGGTLHVDLSCERESAGASGSASAGADRGRFLFLEVSDTGDGIDPPVGDRVIEAHAAMSGKAGGALGLAAVYAAVKRAGGTIQVESERGKGTSVLVRLPRIGEESRSGTHGAPASEATHTILLVDDDEIVRNVVQSMLQADGHRVLSASDSEEALRVCANYPDVIDVLVTDLLMPGIGGEELARRVQQLRSEVRAVVLLSGNPDAAESPDILLKPFSSSQLRDAIRGALKHSQ